MLSHLLTHISRIEWIDAFGAGVYLLTLVTHFGQFRRRREIKTHLWLALAAGAALIVNLSGTELRHAAPDWVPLRFVNLGAACLCMISIYELVESAAQRPALRLMRLLEWLAVGILLTASLAHSRAIGQFMYPLALVFLLVAAVRSIQYAHQRGSDSRLLLGGMLALIASLILDVGGMLKLVPRVEGLPVLGFTLLFFSAARILARRSHREFRELQSLRGDLEQRVSTRTAELAAANAQLHRLARVDSLTSMANRRGFTEQVSQELTATRPNDGALLLLDVDFFKQVNDRFGHDGGDAVLIEIAHRLERWAAGRHLVARWGGEEFIAWLDPHEDAAAAAERLRAAIAGTPIQIGQDSWPVTASIGLAKIDPVDTLTSLSQRADAALYQAKHRGRNQVAEALL